MIDLTETNVQENMMLMVDADTYELNIQPAASILNVFSRLSYKVWYAIAEFVDNSTQSYLSHSAELSSDPSFDKLIVDVRYNVDDNTLTIIDNAYGMEIDKFKNAILLDSKNSEQTGRNEFGMGLKTAASWFGNVWTVISTQLGSQNEYSATVNIPQLKKKGLNSIQIHRNSVSVATHGTTIVISSITKKITAARTIGKIRDLLSSMYRRDINNKNIEVWFNGEPIFFEDYPILTNFRGKSWKKPLDFQVDFSDRLFNVTGFVAIMNPGSFPKAGFALFRQDRVVIGGTDSNYKPSQIFGQIQSQRSLKLFGELNMDDFPVNQAKDGFIWDDGLEDAFIDALKANIQDYVEIADLSIKEREHEQQYSEERSTEVEKEVKRYIDTFFTEVPADNESPVNTSPASVALPQDEISDKEEYIETILNLETPPAAVGKKRTYSVPINAVLTKQFEIQWTVGKMDYWIDYQENEHGIVEVQINIEHPFFMPYSKEENFKTVLEKFVLAFITAEQQAKLTSDKEGYIIASAFKNHMNKYLSKLGGE